MSNKTKNSFGVNNTNKAYAVEKKPDKKNIREKMRIKHKDSSIRVEIGHPQHPKTRVGDNSDIDRKSLRKQYLRSLKCQ